VDGGSFLSLMFTIELLVLLLSRTAPKTKSEESEEEEKREEEEEEEEHGAQNNNAPSMMFASLLPLPLPRVLLLAALSIARRNMCFLFLSFFASVVVFPKHKSQLSLGFYTKP
jgi:hypothetical protein